MLNDLNEEEDGKKVDIKSTDVPSSLMCQKACFLTHLENKLKQVSKWLRKNFEIYQRNTGYFDTVIKIIYDGKYREKLGGEYKVLYYKETGGVIMMETEIKEWVRKQPYWQQFIANEIFKGQNLEKDKLDKIYILFKQENGLVDEVLDRAELDMLSYKSNDNDMSKMTWKEISNIKGVNALKSDEQLKIGNQLTVIYGENGSGKSGYTRILNNAFVSRGDKNILPNIFKDEKLSVGANFSFQDEKKEIFELSFPGDKNHVLFNRISVFDSASATEDLTGENELAFTPIEFAFFDEYIQSFSEIKSRFNTDVESRRKNNEFISCFNDTPIKKVVEQINIETSMEDLRQLADVNELDKEFFQTKMNRKQQLMALNVNERVKEYRSIEQNLNSTKQKIEQLNHKYSNVRLKKTKKLLEELGNLKKLASESGLEALKNEDIHNLGSVEWKKFIQTAKVYHDSIDGDVDQCIFCQQSLEHVTIIDKYWSYLSSEVEKSLATKESEIKKILQDFSSQNFQLFVRQSKFDDWLAENSPQLHESIIKAESEFKLLNSHIVQNLTKFEWEFDVIDNSFDLASFDDTYTLLKDQIDATNSESVGKELAEIKIIEEVHKDKLMLNHIYPEIEKFVNEMKWVSLADTIRLSTNGITAFQNRLFSRYVTTEYVDNFNYECQKLKVDVSVEVKQRGSRGVTLNKLVVKGKNPIEVLSEGEQRSVAVANFLAETALNKANIGIIFDDPVCSLDHKRRNDIALRLVQESESKQVVIFTHDISFLHNIDKHSKENGIECSIKTIDKIGSNSGVIGDSLPWIAMKVNKRKAHLRAELQNITKMHRNMETVDDKKKYEEKVKGWCEYLRETWERSVEEILFNEAVQRFNPSIQTQRLKTASFTKDLYSQISHGMSRCSDWVHDRASALGGNTPKPDELSEYLNFFESFVTENKSS
ncbi:AAA family ATPase [Listeria booriae]|uniref:AAA family ATPase n=1 Tax=Listeria booriae TaxID=1552123 RepID=UPI001624BA6A|nr:AAA family ATPase [Listeria booriae]MBC2390431.1 AAA family ATPase [Listeria booriae]